MILKMFISTTTEYFSAKSGQEMDFALVIAVNSMCQKFGCISSVSAGSPDS